MILRWSELFTHTYFTIFHVLQFVLVHIPFNVLYLMPTQCDCWHAVSLLGSYAVHCEMFWRNLIHHRINQNYCTHELRILKKTYTQTIQLIAVYYFRHV